MLFPFVIKSKVTRGINARLRNPAWQRTEKCQQENNAQCHCQPDSAKHALNSSYDTRFDVVNVVRPYQ